MVTTIFRNIRHALRVLARAPGFSLTAIATLALGIGAATAMFTIVNSVLLRPLPFRDADRVAAVWTRYDASSGYDFPQFSLSGPEFIDYRAQTRALEEVAAFTAARRHVRDRRCRDGADPRVPRVGTANLFTHARRAARARPNVPRRRRSTGRAVRRRVGPRRVARCVRRRPERGRPHRALGRRAVRGHRHHAGGLRVPGRERALVAQRDRRSREPLWSQRLSHNWSAVGRLAPGVTFARGGRRGAHVGGELARDLRPLRRPLRVLAPVHGRDRRRRSARSSRCCSAPWGSCCS